MISAILSSKPPVLKAESIPPRSIIPAHPSATPFFAFGPVEDAIACSFLNVTWEASSGLQDVTLTVINSVPSPNLSSSTINVTIATNFSITSLSYRWSPVTVPQGKYLVVGEVRGLAAAIVSTEFVVANGTNTSCLRPVGAAELPTSQPALSSSRPWLSSPRPWLSSSQPTPSSSPVPSSSIISYTLPSITTLPTSEGSSESPRRHLTDPILGGVIGGLAILAALLGVLLYRHKLRKSSRSSISEMGASEGLVRRGPLTSTDTSIHPFAVSSPIRAEPKVPRDEMTEIAIASSSTQRLVDHSSPSHQALAVSSTVDVTSQEEGSLDLSLYLPEYLEASSPPPYASRQGSLTLSAPTPTSTVSPPLPLHLSIHVNDDAGSILATVSPINDPFCDDASVVQGPSPIALESPYSIAVSTPTP